MNEETVNRIFEFENLALHLYEEAQAQAKNHIAEAELQAVALLEQTRAATAQHIARQQAQTAAHIAANRAQQLAQAQTESAALQDTAAARFDLAVQYLLQQVTAAE